MTDRYPSSRLLLTGEKSRTPAELAHILGELGAPKVLVVGDMILDRYVWGGVERVSPEAPVPVLVVEREEVRLGGAGSVISNLKRLGANVVPFGVLGLDSNADFFRGRLKELDVPSTGILEAPKGRPTTVKTRLLARHQHVLRLDHEIAAAYPKEVEDEVIRRLEVELADADAVLCSDYDKGLFAGGLMGRIADLGREVPVIADPRKHSDYSRYRGLWAITPNRRETELATGLKVGTLVQAREAASVLLEKLDLRFLVLTLDRDGILIAMRDGKFRHLPTRPRSVYDVTGAGDMVLSVLGLMLAGGQDLSVAAALANAAGGLEVERVGVQPLERREIMAEVLGHSARGPIKLASWDQSADLVAEVHRRGGKVVFTNGCFDLLHIGHIRYLRFARTLGDALVVGLNTDRSVKALKGAERPIFGELDRAEQLGALEAVSRVVLFDEDDPAKLIARLRPDILVKGEDYRNKVVVGAEAVESWGGRVEFAPFTPGASTSDLVERIVASRAGE